MVGVTVVGDLWSVAGRWAVVLYCAVFLYNTQDCEFGV